MNMTTKVLTYPNIGISLRKDFYSKYNNLLKEIFDKTNLKVFHHTIILNYREPGHKVSSFFSNEEWSEIYWTKFYANDPVERACNPISKQTGIAISSWQLIDPSSECMETRREVCKVQDGVAISCKNSNGMIENLVFGWEKFDVNTLNPVKIESLNKLISPLRQYHLLNHGL